MEFKIEQIAKILMEVIKPYRMRAIYTSDEIFKEVGETFQIYLARQTV